MHFNFSSDDEETVDQEVTIVEWSPSSTPRRGAVGEEVPAAADTQLAPVDVPEGLDEEEQLDQENNDDELESNGSDVVLLEGDGAADAGAPCSTGWVGYWAVFGRTRFDGSALRRR